MSTKILLICLLVAWSIYHLDYVVCGIGAVLMGIELFPLPAEYPPETEPPVEEVNDVTEGEKEINTLNRLLEERESTVDWK